VVAVAARFIWRRSTVEEAVAAMMETG
jgi:hypothetical protein